MKNTIICLFLMLATLACKPKETTSKEQLPDAKAFGYLHLVGKLGDAPLHMNLIQDQDYDGKPWYNGSYTIDETQEPISVYTVSDTTGQDLLILDEMGTPDDKVGEFKGKLADGSFTGTFTSKEGKEMPFVLDFIYPEGSLKFTTVRVEVSKKADEKLKDSPKATFRYEFVKPKQDWLRFALLSEVVGDSLAKVYKTIETAYIQEQKPFFESYMEEASAQMGEDSDFNSTFLNYESEKSMDVLFNQDNLLSIAVVEYSYSGGAHGNYGSSCASFDLTKQKKITLEDLFKPGYEKTLTNALNAAAKKKYGVKKLDEVLFVDKIEPNGNFFVTSKGICFNYVPYEIASYAQGEQRIYVPFAELKGVLK